MSVARRNRQQAIEVQSITDLMTAFRVRKDELGLNMTKIDALAGFQFGYTGKLFSSPESRAHRRLTDFSLAGMLSALECTLVLVPNDDDDGGKRLRLRISELLSRMQSASVHVAEPIDLEVKKALDALKNAENALRAARAKGGARSWNKFGKRGRVAKARALAERRWAETQMERRKAKRKAAAVKAARARWGRSPAGKARAAGSTGTPPECPKQAGPTEKPSAADQLRLFPSGE